MSFNRIMAALGYGVAWFVVLPACLTVLALTLVMQALIAECAAALFGAEKAMDLATARQLAARMCIGIYAARPY